MAEQRNRWSWDVTGFEPWKSSPSPSLLSPSPPPFPPPLASVKQDDRQPSAPLVRRYSISTSSVLPQSKHSIASNVLQLRDKVKGRRGCPIQKFDQVALETEARITPVINDQRRLFNDLLTSKGNICVFCRTRPLFEDEGPSVVEFPDDYTICVNTGDESLSNSKKDFEFDRVYGPHVGQAELFSDVQPLVQSALDGYNVSIFAYGQTHSGKTHTMEGSIYDRGLNARCFEELFDLANSDTTSNCRYKFCVTVCEL